MAQAIGCNTRSHFRDRSSAMDLNIFCRLYLIWSCLKIYIFGGITMFLEWFIEIKDCGALPTKKGTVAIVTGGSGGIGYETARGLLQHGVFVIIGEFGREECIKFSQPWAKVFKYIGRNFYMFFGMVGGKDVEKGRQAVNKLLLEMPECRVEFWLLDLMSLESVKEFTEKFKQTQHPLHILVNNAGCMMTPYTATEEGFESQIGVNYVGHFFLTLELLDILKKSGTAHHNSRIINVSSIVHQVAVPSVNDFINSTCYSPHSAYSWSKLAVILFTYELQRQLSTDGAHVTVNALHPGVVNTQLYRHIYWFLRILNRYFKTAVQGAYTSLYLALSEAVEGQGGRYYDNCQEARSSYLSYNKKLQRDLWLKTVNVLGLS